MDAVYVFKHSRHGDFELRHSLRSLALHAPWVRKVWIFGDAPDFMADDLPIIEHVAEEAMAPLLGVTAPVRNFFLMNACCALIPGLTEEYLHMSDDFFLLRDLPIEEARRARYLQDLATVATRGRGVWKDQLWRTYDTLISLGYAGLNFETHAPSYLKQKWVTAAYAEFKEFVTEQRFQGMTGLTAILNHAHKADGLPLTSLAGSRCGFWGRAPSHEEADRQSEGKMFLNFDDRAFGDGLARFLAGRFPDRCLYER
jgi:hypothetical protein